jgi:hypothetical protein
MTLLACARAMSSLCIALSTATDVSLAPAPHQPCSPIAADPALVARAVSAIRASQSVLKRALLTAAYVALASKKRGVRTPNFGVFLFLFWGGGAV